MPEVECRREGVRVIVNNEDHIEAIIYSDDGVPEFCDQYEINLGGIKVNTHFSVPEHTRVRVSLFDNHDQRLEIISTIVSVNVKSSVIKFDDLNQQQYETLCSMLKFQQPSSE